MDKNLRIFVSISAFIIITVLIYISIVNRQIDKININIIPKEKKSDLKKFKTVEDFVKTLDNIIENYRNDKIVHDDVLFSEKESEYNFSQTNVQIQGVDEADIVKTDGNYIFTVTNNYITITKAIPAEEAELVSKIEIKNSLPKEIFVDENKLMVFGNRQYQYNYESQNKSLNNFIDISFVELYDISDKVNPELKKKLEFEGNYKSSRKIGSEVYFIMDVYPHSYYTRKDDSNMSDEEKCQKMVPQYREGINLNENSEMQPVVHCTDINYVEPVEYVQYVEVISISMKDENRSFSKEVILGGGDNVYASEKNIFLAKNMYNSFSQPSRGPEGIFAPEYNYQEDVKILKFKIDNGSVIFEASGTVPGRVLNQFSMDEFEHYFRIATTNSVNKESIQSQNNVYILDSNLKISGFIENIAPGEKIYSARFMGKRGFLVTFKKVDPFFTLDLSDPNNPRVVGKLKIPGYSDYLHPYDENHIIGIGKNTVEASNELSKVFNFAWYQGMKMAIFDVTDFENPKEMFKIEIGDRGTESPVLWDHKALLFSKEKELLVIPILEAKLTEIQKKNSRNLDSQNGEYVYQGAYVFKLNLNDGFSFQGKITHLPDGYFKKTAYNYHNDDLFIKRNLYIGDNLYTVSNRKIEINKLSDLSELKKVDFGFPFSPNPTPVFFDDVE